MTPRSVAPRVPAAPTPLPTATLPRSPLPRSPRITVRSGSCATDQPCLWLITARNLAAGPYAGACAEGYAAHGGITFSTNAPDPITARCRGADPSAGANAGDLAPHRCQIPSINTIDLITARTEWPPAPLTRLPTCRLRNRPALLVSIAQSTGTLISPPQITARSGGGPPPPLQEAPASHRGNP